MIYTFKPFHPLPVVCLLLAMWLGGCRSVDINPAATPTPSATLIPANTDTPAPTATLTPTVTPTPTNTATPLPTATPTSLALVEPGTPVPGELPPIAIDNAYAVSGIASFKAPNLSDLDWSPSGENLAAATHSGITIYEALSRVILAELDTPTGLVSIDYSPRGTLLAAGHQFGSEEVGYAGNVDVWRVSSWESLGPILGGRQAVSEVAFSPDGKRLASVFTSANPDDNRVVFWDTQRWEISGTLSTGAVMRIAFSPDSKLLAVSPDRYAVTIWNLVNNQRLQTLHTSFTGAVNSMAFSPDGSTLATGHYDGEIRLWNPQTGELKQVLKSTGVVESLAFNPDGTLLASGEGVPTNTVRLWDVEIAQVVRSLETHDHGVISLSFSPNGRLLASGSFEGAVWLWGVRP
jgi:WD40 repeat protein